MDSAAVGCGLTAEQGVPVAWLAVCLVVSVVGPAWLEWRCWLCVVVACVPSVHVCVLFVSIRCCSIVNVNCSKFILLTFVTYSLALNYKCNYLWAADLYSGILCWVTVCTCIVVVNIVCRLLQTGDVIMIEVDGKQCTDITSHYAYVAWWLEIKMPVLCVNCAMLVCDSCKV